MGFLDSIVQNDSAGTVKTPVQSGGGFFDNLVPKSAPKTPLGSAPAVQTPTTTIPPLVKAPLGTTNKVQDVYSDLTTKPKPVAPVNITQGLIDAYHGVKGAIQNFATQKKEPKPSGFFENLVTDLNKLPQSEIGPSKDIPSTTKNPDAGTFFPKIFKPANELNQPDINVKVPFTQKYVSVPSMFDDPRAFGGNKDNIVNKGVNMIANLPSDIIQSIPRALVTIKKEKETTGKTTSEHLSPFLAAMYGSPEYENVNTDIQKRIANGDGVLSSYLGGISGKTLDVVFGASVAAGALTKTAEILARGDNYSKIEAWKTLGSPKSEAELTANYKKYAQQFHPDKPTGNASAMTTVNDAKSIIDKTGLPTTIDFAKQNGAKYTEWLGLQTELGPAEHFLKPDIEMKPGIQSKPLGTLQLPGSRSVPGQAPAFGMSTEAVESVGGETSKGGFFDDLLKPEEKGSLSTDSKSIDNSIVNKEKTPNTPGNVLKPEFPANSSEIPKSSSVSETPNTSVSKAPVYQGEKDLSIKTLEKLAGRSTVSKTFIENLTNQPDLKQQEREVVRAALKDFPDGSQVPVAELAKKVKAELLPLERVAQTKPKYESVTLPDSQRGDIANYSEHVYKSPIKTYAGNVHFSGNESENYFGHTRVEDLANKPADSFNRSDLNTPEKLQDMSNGVRRVIEVQSDLYQKGNLENEIPKNMDIGALGIHNEGTKWTIRNADGDIENIFDTESEAKSELTKLEEPERNRLKPLQQYNDPTAHFRMVREEVKQAAKDGKTALQFPTGETAMKIEGLAENNYWYKVNPENSAVTGKLSTEDLKVGLPVKGHGGNWIITDVVGDGKFKAIQKNRLLPDTAGKIRAAYDKDGSGYGEINGEIYIKTQAESFDISGKVDTSNPIYKFYEKDLGRYLTSKYGAVRVTDGKGVSWYEVPVSKEHGSKPVEAFSRSFLGKATPTLGRGGAIPHDEIKQYIYKDIPKDQVRLIFRDGLVDGYANGKYTGVRAEMKGILKPMIELSSKGGKSKITTAFHESGHYIFDNFLSTADKRAVLKLAEKEMGPITGASYRLSGYKGKETILEEYVMDKYADYKANEAGYASSPFKSFFRKLDEIIQKIKDIYNKAKGNLDKFFEERGGSQSGRINYMDPLGEGEPKKTPFGKSVGKITVGGKEIDVTKGGTMEIPVSKSSLPANTLKQTNPLGEIQSQRPSSSLPSQNQKVPEKKVPELPQPQEKQAMSQTGQRPLGSFPQTKVDTLKASPLKSSLKDRLQPNEIKVNKTPEVAFEQSKNQVPIGNTKFVIGDYGKNAIERKTELGQNDRLPISDLSASIDHIKSAYVAGDSSFRKGNIVHISEMPNGETRAIITRKNLSGKEEVINFFKVGRPVAPFIENLKSFGIPERNRTSDRLVRTEELYPLSYGDKNIVSKSNPNVKQIDNLIANGKIKVVLLSGKDTYLVKTGDTWKTARDEDSAIVQATPKEKTVIELPPELEQKVKAVEMQKEQLDNSPFKSKSNSIFKDKEERVRELGDVKNPETIKKMEDRIAESGIQDPTKFAEGMENYFDKKKEVAKMEKEVKAEVADYKKNGSRIQTLERIKTLREDVKTLESNSLNADKQKAEIKRLTKENKLGLGSSGVPLKTSREGVPMALTERQKNIVENSPFKDGPEIHHPPFEGSYGEVKATEILAKQAESIMHGNDIPPDVSMRELIEKTVTPVTRKVNILDTYLRTPDRVMTKIGFGTEAKDLRRAMDGYWKELPKNLAKIGEWSKVVPAKSNERIFRFLDGQAIDLRPDEHLVASEIKKWLKEWADRLGIEEDRRVSDYITRIFANDTPQEFDEELEKIITDTVPGSVYNPFTLRRLGARGYKMDTWKALEAYVKRGTRKVYMDPVLEKIEARTGHELATTDLEKSQFKYIQRYINNINMRPSETDESIDNLIKTIFTNKTVAKIYGGIRKGSLGILPEVGQRPVASITRFMRQMTSRAMLGLNPGSALRNISQGMNTYAVLGEKYTTIGYASLFKKGAMQELNEQGVLNASFIQDKVLSATGKILEKADKGLYFFFETAEKINRGAAYFGAKSKALASGKTEEQAIEYAKDIVRKTQFSFDSIDIPVGMGSDIVKTLLQFQTYTTKQAEFLTEMVKDKNVLGLLRYAVAGLAFVYTIGKIFGMKPQELVPIWRIGLPPSWTIPSAVVSASANLPDKYGRTLPLGSRVKNVWDAILKSGIPAGSQINKSYQGFKAVQQGGSMDAAGRKQFSVGGSLGKNIQAIAFGKYANSAADDHFNGITEAERTYDNISKSKTAKDDFDKLIKANPALAKEVLAIAKRRQAGITPDDEKIINMGVASGARARYVADKLNNLKTNQEKGALWVEYVKKKIITKDVATQLAKLIKK